MSQSDRAIKKLATEIARIRAEVKSWRGAQADFTSIENGGNFTFKDGDGNVTAIVGGQDDGSNTIRHVDGPVPPIPSGLAAHVDGPIVQVSWDGSFEDADEATYDWSHLEVVAVGPDNENLRATINDVTGASASVAATVSGEWTVVARSVSRAEKRSLDGDAGTVEVKLVDIDGAIDAVQDSANGKNKVTYSDRPPTPADPGIFDDTWFVGQVGRPNDVVEATNLATNPAFGNGTTGWISSNGNPALTVTNDGRLQITATGTRASFDVDVAELPVAANQWVGVSMFVDAEDESTSYILWRWRIPGSAYTYDSTDSSVKAKGGVRIFGAFRAPSGVSSVLPRLTFRSSTMAVGSKHWMEEPVFAVADSEADALAQIAAYFDGDTEDGATDNESHYRWTGEPHASTSEKYLPALNIGDSDNWNIIEQYRHDGTGWVKVELSHHVFSTVDLGKATVGELDGIRIMGQTVRGEQLSGDAIDGKVITGATYRTSGGNGSWSDAGLFIAQPDGTSMVRFPTDGSPLSLTASDTQIERASIAELDLSNGAVRSGGEFTLASGVTAPASPPELTTGWSKFAALAPPSDRAYPPHAWESLGYWSAGNAWVRSVNIFGASSSEPDKVEIFDYATGSFIRSFNIELNPTNNLTVIGDIVYLFGDVYSSSGVKSTWIYGYNLNTGARTSRHEYTRSIQAKNALGNDGTNLIIASVYNLELWVHRRDPVTGVQVGSDMRSGSNSWPATGGKDLYGVRINGNDVEVVTSWGARVYLNSNNALVRKTDTANASGYAGWELPAHDVSGCAWVNGTPFPVDSSGNIYQGSNIPSDTTAQMCYTWFDGTHETTPSTVSELVIPAQRTVISSVPVRVGLQKKLYTNLGGWYWSVVGEDQTSVVGISVAGSGSPPTVNSFPNADPAVFRSTNGNVVVRGDGSGKWGPLTFNADGTMSSSQIPEWVPITSFPTGFGPNSWGYVPAYRIWPDGKVEWRGVVAGPIPASAITPVLNVPAAARPAQPVNVTAGVSGTVGQPLVIRAEFGGLNTSGSLTVMGNGEARTWVSLESIYYYLT